MAELSIDILHLVFPLLGQRDKLECMTVCHQWNQIISHYSLFRVVRVDHKEQLDKLIDTVKRQPFQGAKVERLILDLRLDKDFDMTVLVDLFPNVRDFVALNIRDHHFDMESIERRAHNHPWCNIIKNMAEYTSDVNIKTLLSFGICSQLTSIAMEGEEGQPADDFIAILGNAPALRILDMSQYYLSLQDLELLHRVAPHLVSLVLESIEFDCTSLPLNIVSAYTVKTLKLNSSRVYTANSSIPHLEYISKKYTQLNEFSYDVRSFDYEEIELEAQYKAATAHYMKILGAQLQTLSLNLDSEGVNPFATFDFDVLDRGQCQIRKLSLGHEIRPSMLHQLVQTTQIRYIQSLTINHLLDCTSLEWLKPFMMLKELTLHFPYFFQIGQRQRFDLTQLLGILGDKLETLRLYSLNLKFDTNTLHQYPLKNLTLFKVTLPPKTDTFITQSFPHLRSLKFERCFWYGRSFTLPNTNLSYLEITDKFPREDRHILVITLNDNKRRLYSANVKPFYFISSRHDVPKDRFAYPSISSEPFDGCAGVPFLTFVCNSLYTFFTMNSMY
ncbi:hypothetical protein K501DRAFT_274594 [Backusella circina FSU 941]|nr:hypothetical protein K501DRAFT_274594 [Backusella circina FSU 941]